MKSCKRTAFAALACISLLFFSCGGGETTAPPEPEGEAGEASGYFTDVRAALDELEAMTSEVKTEWDKKSGVSRKEWRVGEDAVDRYYLPLMKTDYYYYDDEDIASADPLMRIFLDEWESYRALSASPGAAGEMTQELQAEVDALADEAEALLAETPPIHTEMVRRIIGLRYRTLLLKAGVDPEEIP
jgi:hypothetical protein